MVNQAPNPNFGFMCQECQALNMHESYPEPCPICGGDGVDKREFVSEEEAAEWS
jgi:hypothetical protein